MKITCLVSQLLVLCFFTTLSARRLSAADVFAALDSSSLAGDFLEENKVLEGEWTGGKNFTPKACARGFYSFRVKAKGTLDKVKMDLTGDNEMDVYGKVSDAYGRVSGEYLGDYSACQNVAGWLGIGIDSIEVKTKVHVTDESDKIKLKVYQLKLGRLRLGKHVPDWFENLATRSVNKALIYVWKTQLGDWLSARLGDYINSLKDKRGL
jgi:hypothetical protein